MATYYVANDGSNGNAGTSEGAPWETLAYAEANTTSNDTLYLKRGDTFYLTENFSPYTGMTLGAYGSGDRPEVIAGVAASSLSWTDEGSNVYSTTGADGWWSNVHTPGVSDLDSYGYAHWDSAAELNTRVGFFWDEGTPDTLYVHTQTGDEPSAQILHRWSALTITNNNVTVENIRFLHGSSFFVNAADGLTVDNCAIDWMSYYGYEGESDTNSTVQNCTFSYNGRGRGGAALTMTSNAADNVVENCTATENGSNPLLGDDGKTESTSWGGGFEFGGSAARCTGRYNIVKGMGQDNVASDLLLTIEGSGTDSCVHHHSIAYNGVVLMNISGGSNNKLHNNSVWGVTRTTDTGNNAPCCLQTVGAHDSCEVKNNIMSRGTFDLTGSTNSLIRISATSTNNDIDYNQYYDQDGSPAWYWNNTNYTTFASYKTASSLDANSAEGDPDYVDPSNGDLRVNSGSAVDQAGVDLDDGGSYNTVLDMSVTDTSAQTFRFTSSTTHVSAYFDTAGAISVDRVRVKAYRIGTPAGGTPAWWAEMWDDSSGDPGSQLGSDSDTKDPSTLTTSAGSADTVEFTFPSTIELSGSTSYHVVFQGDYTISTSHHVRIRVDELNTDDDATRGFKESSNFSSWTDRPNREPWIQLQEAVAAAALYTVDYAGDAVQSPPNIGAYDTLYTSNTSVIAQDLADTIKFNTELLVNIINDLLVQN